MIKSIKKIILTLTFIALFVMLPFTVFASEYETVTSEETYITYLEDGSYYTTTIETVTVPSILLTSTSSVTETKAITYSSSTNEKLWTVTVKGTFTYDGTSSKCTKASHTIDIYNNSWYIYSQNSYASENKAIADVTMKKKTLGIVTSTRSVNLTLTCDKNGKFS